jgi:L-threonylcarbamoyladenylate synthase
MTEDFTHDLEQCLRVLTSGGLILYPTDTVWGLGCDATNEKAVEKLIQLKGKKPNQGLIILLATERDVLQYVTQLDMSVFDYLNTRSKPTTVIYEGGTGVADPVLAHNGTIAIRLVKEDFCRHLIKRFRKPIVSTSANFHTAPTPTYFHEVDAELKKSVDYIVQYRQHDTKSVSPSSIIKWSANGSVEIMR